MLRPGDVYAFDVAQALSALSKGTDNQSVQFQKLTDIKNKDAAYFRPSADGVAAMSLTDGNLLELTGHFH